MGAQLQGRIKGAHRGNRSHKAMSEINVTPFVDVMLVLLVVFMITAPLLSAGVDITLPEVSNKRLTQQDNSPVEISMNIKGEVFFGKELVTPGELQEVLKVIAAESPEKHIYIRADQKLDYGQVMGAMSLVKNAGLKHVALISDPTYGKGG